MSCSSDGCHISSGNKDTHLNRCLNHLHEYTLGYFAKLDLIYCQQSVGKLPRGTYFIRILFINSIKYFKQSFTDIWTNTASKKNEYYINYTIGLCRGQNDHTQPSHHPKVIEDKPPTIGIINSNVPRML